MTLDIKKGVVGVKKGNTPVQMLFCLKEKNQKKINSHRWFFQAFGTVLDPNICVLIDAGTKPGKDSIYQLWKAFDLEPMCAGACGEIKAMLVHGKKLLNPLVATQNFEYKMSNILDKPLESAFGFITVLPGAFSAYRYVALQNDKTGQGPLEKYFAGEKMHGANAGIFTANMYLAEDRILCFELVSKRNCHWILQYVKSSNGETDVPTTMAEFIGQRRRWLNGSFFAAVYALAHSFDIFRSDHSAIRKTMFLIEFFYQTISMIFAWFALGNFFLVFHILTGSLATYIGVTGKVLFILFEWLYIAVLITCFILSLGNRPQGSNKWYMSMVYFWCIIMTYLMFASVFITVKSIQGVVNDKDGFSFSDVFQNTIFFNLIVSLASTYVMWFIVSFLFLDPWHMFTCFIQYLLMTPTYINILNVYAFCNTHDITWGTKGDDKPEKLPSVTTKADGKADIQAPTDDADLNTMYEKELQTFSAKWKEEKKIPSPQDKQEDYYKGFRSGVVLFWMLCNLGLTALVLQSGGLEVTVADDKQNEHQTRVANIYLGVVLWSVAGLAAFRFIGAVWFLIVRMVSLHYLILLIFKPLTSTTVPRCLKRRCRRPFCRFLAHVWVCIVYDLRPDMRIARPARSDALMALFSVACELHDFLQVLYLDSKLSCIKWHDLLVQNYSIVFHFSVTSFTLSLHSLFMSRNRGIIVMSLHSPLSIVHLVKHTHAAADCTHCRLRITALLPLSAVVVTALVQICSLSPPSLSSCRRPAQTAGRGRPCCIQTHPTHQHCLSARTPSKRVYSRDLPRVSDNYLAINLN